MLRFFAILLALVAVLLLGLPSAIGTLGERPPVLEAPAAEPDGTEMIPVRLYFPATQETKELPLGEYLKGVVAAEMPAEFAPEALKAQFVVARTYVVRRMHQFGGKGGCPPSPAADICADPRYSQAYISKEELIERHGALAANSYWKLLEQAGAETAGQVLTYAGELIDPLYHSVSGRKTENAEEYFTQALPYLVAVSDQWGADSPRLVARKRFAPEVFARSLVKAGQEPPILTVTAAARSGASPVTIADRTSTGRVKTVRVGDLTLTGREFRERLGLASSDFRVTLEDGEVVVETHGYGHGVGMSQYGADGMARAGKKYPEILHHYYTGVKLTHLFGE